MSFTDTLDLKTKLLVRNITERLKSAEIPDEIKNRFINDIKLIEFLHPFTSIPAYIYTVADHYTGESKAKKNEKAVREIREIIADVPHKIGELVANWFSLNGDGNVVNKLLSKPFGARFIQQFILDAISQTGHDDGSKNDLQIEESKKLDRDGIVQFFVYGHTHIPGMTQNGSYHFNTGKWKPTIGALRKNGSYVFQPPTIPTASLTLRTDLSKRDGRRKVNVEFRSRDIECNNPTK